MKTINMSLPENQYYKESFTKKQIVLHHTVSGVGVDGDVATWRSNSDRIATAIIIAHNGDVYICFDKKYWGHHLGVKQDVFKAMNIKNDNLSLNKYSIGIEIDSAGGLTKKGDYWYSTFGKKIDSFIEYDKPYRGFKAFEKYTNAQIESLRILLTQYCQEYKIDKKYQEQMWDVNIDALSGKNGIFTHTSYRIDKSDCHPQPELISMLKTL